MDSNKTVIDCLEAQTYYIAMSERNRQLSNEAWLGRETWIAKSNVQALIAEVFLTRAENLTER